MLSPENASRSGKSSRPQLFASYLPPPHKGSTQRKFQFLLERVTKGLHSLKIHEELDGREDRNEANHIFKQEDRGG